MVGLFGIGTKKRITTFEGRLPREELLRLGRTLVVDDERPELVDDLQKLGFVVEHVADLTAENLHLVEGGRYDLILLDFGNVGRTVGKDEGLSLLQHIKRTNPSVVVYAYTSKALRSLHADFYRLADGVLAKDASITESAEKVEEGLAKSRDLHKLWRSMLTVGNVNPTSATDLHLQDLFVRGLSDRAKLEKFRETALALFGAGAKKLGGVLIAKLVELLLHAH